MRYLPEGLIQAQVSRDKLNETSESKLDILLWLIEISSLIPNQLENLESALELCRVEIIDMTLSLLFELSYLSTGSSLQGPSCLLSKDLIMRGLSILYNY